MSSYWCYRCNRIIRIWSQDPITCPDCDSGFIEEVDLSPRFIRGDRRRGGSRFPPSSAMYMLSNPDNGSPSSILRPGRRNGVDRSPFNPVIVLRGNRGGSPPGDSGDVEDGIASSDEHIRGFELYYDDGGRSGLRPLPPSMSEFLLGSGFDRVIDQLSQIEINNIGRYEHPPASKAAIESMPTLEIKQSHVATELFCAICMEPFELGSEAREMPCKHLYHPNCILPWLSIRNSCPVCRHELPMDAADAGTSTLNSEEPMGLTIWRLPGGGFAVGRFSGGRRGGDRDLPVVYTEMDGGFGSGLPRRVSWGSGGNRGRERGGLMGRVIRNLFGCFGGSGSSSSLDPRISRSSRSLSHFSASSSRRGWPVETNSGRGRW